MTEENRQNPEQVQQRLGVLDKLREWLPLTFRGQAMLLLVPAIVIMSLVYNIESISTERKILKKEIVNKGEAVAAIVASTAELPVLSENIEHLKNTARSVIGLKDIAFVSFYNKNCDSLLHEGKPYPHPPKLQAGAEMANHFYEHRDMFEFIAPVVTLKAQEELFLLDDGKSPAPSPEKVHIGWVRIGLSKDILSHAERGILLRGTVLTIIFTLCGIALVYPFISLATRPLHDLIAAVKEVGEGEYAEVRAVSPKSEIGRLSSEFNRMSQAIREREEALQENVQELEQMQETLQDNVQELEQQVEAREAAEIELINHRDHLEELITERTAELTIAKDQAEASNRAKSDFLSSMSHELRTPLNAILGYAQILRRQENMTDQQRQQLEIMNSSGEHLLTLINDILDVGKIEASKMEVEDQGFDLPALLRQVMSLTRLHAEEKELHFGFEEIGAVPRYVHGDERKLRQILLNLLSNAVKYTRKGGITLRVGYRDDEAGLFFCEVADTGIGIPLDKQEAVFEPFTQLAASGQARVGTGLGLNITKRLLTLMGGTLTLESQSGRGSVFRLEAPLPAISEHEVAPQLSAVVVTGYIGDQKRILVVDDTVGNTAMLVALLEPLGFELDTAMTGVEALQRVEHRIPDLVLMDLVMPEMDGLEAVKQIRRESRFPGIKIIGASATVTKGTRKEDFVAVCDDFIEKPIHIDLLLEKISELLAITWKTSPERLAQSRIGTATARGAEPLAAPPAEKLDELYEIARRGDMLKIDQWAAEMTEVDPMYAGFAETLHELASGFKTKAILALVEQFRRNNHD
ncbi:MAG: ATP-binding protein [Desulfuromonadaceae bacterium]|nr:ATP-binding protein [Desulfuromonadaceae bacterium]MDD5105764.1 ATP-binding protein [Desulfuromonadaceae bacterium]